MALATAEIQSEAILPVLTALPDLDSPPLDPVVQAVVDAREVIRSSDLEYIEKAKSIGEDISRLGLLGESAGLPELRAMQYDVQAVVRQTAERATFILQGSLPEGPLVIGETLYFVHEDPGRDARTTWLTFPDDKADVSFMELRGFRGEGDANRAHFSHHAQLLFDLIQAADISPES